MNTTHTKQERPILFSGAMVRAILDGHKTQTRRVVKPVGNDGGYVLFDSGNGAWPYRSDDGESCFHTVKRGGNFYLDETPIYCPYGQNGDRLWVRETWKYNDWTENGEPFIKFAADGDVTCPKVSEDWSDRIVDIWEILSRESNFNIDNCARDRKWRPSIHMPRWASRILLEIVSVRVERLNDISETDAKAEGVTNTPYPERFLGSDRRVLDSPIHRMLFRDLWQSINGHGSCDLNPWVWAIEFRRVDSNG